MDASLVVEDVAQVVVVVVSVYMGWSAWTRILDGMIPKFKRVGKTMATNKHKAMPGGPICDSSKEECVQSVAHRTLTVRRPHSGLALLEQYGVLGATLGAWQTSD
mmetsp:Transcript_111924/g.316298  ORF Transcript_111924/g.316298 Transcript_111924/m.316298 type:complete len:105 (-) Transcript_111924:251-565(-)